MGVFLTFLEAIAMILKALLTCNLVALLAMLGATALMVDTIQPDHLPADAMSASPLDRQS
jgi:hypothetical protein